MSTTLQKRPPQQNNTIDEKHTEMLNRFHSNETEKVPRLEQEIDNLKTKVKTLQDNQIDQYMEIRDKIRANKLKIKEIKQEKKQYFLNNSKYIFGYF